MRLLACLVFVASCVAACQHTDAAEQSAATVAKAPAATVAIPAALTPAEHSCGGGGSCGGKCGNDVGGGCAAAMAEAAPTFAAVPSDARWTELKVTGMHCGGCARRIERGLAKVDGVLGVKVDLAAATVMVATAKTVDGRSLAKPAIDGLGYQVQ